MKKVLITSALPYANGPLHFGHLAGAYLPGDAYARFQRLQGADVLYLCGSDEYGIAITLSAELAGRTPQQQVDLFHEMNKTFFDKMEISFDHYARTTWPRHQETVQAFFLDLLKNGHIEERVTEQLFSEKEQRFLADRYVQGGCPRCGFDKARGDECPSCAASYEATDLQNPVSKMTGSPLVKKETKHWFLRFDHFAKELEAWLATKSWKPSVKHFAMSYLQDLRPRAITRDGEWGIPVPLDGTNGKVLYVWFDAPIGYISAAKEWAELQGDKELWKSYFLDEKTKYVQFIGKDNIPFHAIFFPAMIMGQNMPYKLVDELPANEFYHLEGKQFSKSEGWTIDVESFFAQFSSDQIRYAIGSNAPETGDSSFSWEDFQHRCNAELLGKYGNFVHRVLVFVREHMNGVIPPLGDIGEEDAMFFTKTREIVASAKEAFENFSLRKACQQIMLLAQEGNVYFDQQAPWKLRKDPSKQKKLCTVLRACLECIKLLALISFPVIPTTGETVWTFLGYKNSLSKNQWDLLVDTLLVEGTALGDVHLLFTRVEDDVIAREVARLHQKTCREKEEVTIEEVKKIDLRVAEILAAVRVPKSQKLVQLRLSLGTQERTIVAGIGEGREDLSSLIGKKIVICANLVKAKIMGIESEGMLLAAKGLHGIEPLEVSQSVPGDVVS